MYIILLFRFANLNVHKKMQNTCMNMYMGLGILIVKHGVLKVYEPCLVDCFQEVSIHSPQGNPADLYLTNTNHYIKNLLRCDLTRQWFSHYVHT